MKATWITTFPLHFTTFLLFPPIKDLRQVSEKLGSLLNSRLYVGQTDQFKQQLQEISQNRQLPLERVVNCPIKRYNDRTCVHLATSNGLYECLEELLKSGGKFAKAVNILSATCTCT